MPKRRSALFQAMSEQDEILHPAPSPSPEPASTQQGSDVASNPASRVASDQDSQIAKQQDSQIAIKPASQLAQVKQLNVRIPVELHKRLSYLSIEIDREMADIVAELLERFLSEVKRKD